MEPTTLQDALTADEIEAANELTRRWLTSRYEVPAVASGLGIWPLLAVLATGAVDATRDELLEAAGIDASRDAAVPAALLDAARTAPAIRLALAAWAGPRIALDPEWIARLPVESIRSLTGDSAVDKPALDEWATRNTGGLIERMPVDLDEPIELLLASALSVRTKWRTPFEERHGPFLRGRLRSRSGHHDDHRLHGFAGADPQAHLRGGDVRPTIRLPRPTPSLGSRPHCRMGR